MVKIKKILISLISIYFLLNSYGYAKYKYNFDEEIIELSRDSDPPICDVYYSKETWTNENVIITITSNKEIEQASGFELSENRKVLTKEVSENEYGIIKVRDFSGNCTEVEYNVSNIDKQAPQIIGCENGGIYSGPLKLDYKDNVEIKEVRVDKYSDNLTIDSHNVYYDSYYYFGMDRSSKTIKVSVMGHPINTRKYKYYLNGTLYTTTDEKEYIFTGLNSGTKYKITVEAIDKNGNVIDRASRDEYTTYFESIYSNKSQEKFYAIFGNLDNDVNTIRYAVWNYYDQSDLRWYDSSIINNCAGIEMTPFNTSYYPSYIIQVYMYDSDNNILDIVGFSIDFNTYYVKNNSPINKYELSETGNYQIYVSDLAGNEIVYYIKVK